LEALLIELAETIGAAHVFLFRHDSASKLLRLELAIVDKLVRWGPNGEEMSLWAAPFPDDITPAWKLMCEHRGLFTPSMTIFPPEQFAWPGAFEYARRFEMSDIGHIVLFAGDAPIGSIGLGFRHGKRLQADDRGLIEAVAGQATIALRMLDLGEQARQAAIAREREAAAVQRAAQLAKANSALSRSMVGLSKSADFDQALDAVLGEIVAAADAAVGFLFGYDPEKKTLRTLFWLDETGRGAGTCPHAPPLLRGEFDADITPFFRIFVGTADILTADLLDLPQDVRDMTWPGVYDWHLANGRRCACAIPILIGERPLGIIGLAWHRNVQFSLEQKSLLFSLAGQAAVVVQLKDLAEAQRAAAIARAQEQAAREQAEQLSKANRALQTTIDALSTLSDLNQFVPAVLQAVARAFGAAECAYYQHGENEPIRLRYWFHDNRVLTPEELLRVDGEMMEVIRELANGFHVPENYLGTPPRMRNRAVVVDHMKGTGVARFDEFAKANGWDLELNVPLVVNDAADGALIIYRKSDLPYSSSEIALAETLGKQLALAMQTTSLARQARDMAIAQERENAARERSNRLAGANEALKQCVDALVHARDDAEVALGRVLAVLSDYLKSQSAALWLADPTSGRFDLHLLYVDEKVISARDEKDLELMRRWGRGHGLVFRRHLEETRPVVYGPDDIEGLSRVARAHLKKLGVRMMIGVPLLLGETVIGCLTVRFNQVRTFDGDDLELAQAVAHQATATIQMSRMAERGRNAAVAEERNRLAREVHDTLAQGYAGILMQIGAVEAELGAAKADTEIDSIYRPFFSTIRRLAQDNLAEARRSVAALRPVALERGDLSEALRQAVEDAGKQYVATPRFLLGGSVRTLPPHVEGELLRIAIEALSNAFQYGGPGVSVTVELSYAPTGSVRIAVSDDGRGFDASAPVAGHFGLLGMNERASRIGAELTLVTAEGEGTEVVVVWSPQFNRSESPSA
jgi:signal transduction histidine kinase